MVTDDGQCDDDHHWDKYDDDDHHHYWEKYDDDHDYNTLVHYIAIHYKGTRWSLMMVSVMMIIIIGTSMMIIMITIHWCNTLRGHKMVTDDGQCDHHSCQDDDFCDKFR